MGKTSIALAFALASCAHLGADVMIPLSVFSVETHRAKDVLIRVVRYNIDKSELRLESVRPIHHELLDFIDIKSFTVASGAYVFEKCDELLISPVKVTAESVQVEFECFLPRGGNVVAACTVQIEGLKFGKMACERKEQ
jgi:hypothetical protein